MGKPSKLVSLWALRPASTVEDGMDVKRVSGRGWRRGVKEYGGAGGIQASAPPRSVEVVNRLANQGLS